MDVEWIQTLYDAHHLLPNDTPPARSVADSAKGTEQLCVLYRKYFRLSRGHAEARPLSSIGDLAGQIQIFFVRP